MAYEPSEIMFAAAMLFTPNQLKAAAKSVDSLTDFIDVLKQRATSGVIFGNEAMRKEFLKLINVDNIKDAAVGISAALGMKAKAGAASNVKTPRVYMTGNSWPKEVEMFRISAYGFTDYNSADIIFTYDGSNFYGVSLKKKNTSDSADPTVINKAFDSLMQGKEFDSVKKTLLNARISYFSDLVVEAVNSGIISKKDIKDFDKLVKTKEGKKELFEAKKRNRTLFDKAYIDTKGYATAKGKYKSENTRDPKSMRYFVNKKLGNIKNPLYSQMISVLNSNADLFAESLINIILKTKLYEELSAKKLKGYKFSFYLVTGIGNVTNTNVSYSNPSIISLSNTLTALTKLEKKYARDSYSIVLDKAKNVSSDAAKIFCKLVRGNLVLLDLEIRYKGSFTSQPQFQGFIHSDFKHLLTSEK